MEKEFNLQTWLEKIKSDILNTFGHRVKFIGYQGSYKRGEASDNSDVDMVVVLDKVSIDDLKKYRNIVQNLAFSEKACGFLGGAKEVLNWSKPDIFQLIYDTEPLYGSLEELAPEIETKDVQEAVKNGAANLYHAAVHSFLYDTDPKIALSPLFKGTFFILQAKYFLKSQDYICTKKELVSKLIGPDREILEMCINRAEFADFDTEKIDNAYAKLISWASGLLC